MKYVGRNPSPPLDRFIERIWYSAETPTHEQERVIPGGGTMDLVVSLAHDETCVYDPGLGRAVRTGSGTVVAGVRTRSILIDPRQRTSVIGAHFWPGGMYPFLGISAVKLLDTHVPLGDLWGSAGRRLRGQLRAAGSTEEQFDILEALLLERLGHARPQHPAVAAGVAALRNGVAVAEVAQAVGLSQRRFIEVFEREVGITPKLFARLQRFHRVKKHIASLGAAPPSWAAFAIECGYCDQSHMIRDFVEFSSLSPESYLRGGAEETRFDQAVHAYRGTPSA